MGVKLATPASAVFTSAAIAYRNAALNAADSLFTAIAHDTVVVQTADNPFNAATGAFTAARAGRLHVTAVSAIANVAYTNLVLAVFKDGVVLVYGPQFVTGTWDTIWFADTVQCVAGSAYDVRVFQQSTAARALTTGYLAQHVEFNYLGA